jgi:hypothetical protein
MGHSMWLGSDIGEDLANLGIAKIQFGVLTFEIFQGI